MYASKKMSKAFINLWTAGPRNQIDGAISRIVDGWKELLYLQAWDQANDGQRSTPRDRLWKDTQLNWGADGNPNDWHIEFKHLKNESEQLYWHLIRIIRFQPTLQK